MLEAVLGHATFAGLVRRPVLSCFHACYSYIQRSYHTATPLWPTVVEDLRAFRGLIPYLVSDWSSPWNRMVFSSDASEEGYGVTASIWPERWVKSVGRERERDRFLLTYSIGARASALKLDPDNVVPDS